MNPMYQKIAFSFIRYALAVTGYGGLVSDDGLMEAIGAAATLVLAVWSVYKNFKERQVLVTALQGAALSENDVKLLVKDPAVVTPSVTVPKDMVPA